MRFKRQDLINSLKHRLEQDRTAHDASQARTKASAERENRRIADRHMEDYDRLRVALTRAIRDGRPLYTDEVPAPLRERGYGPILTGVRFKEVEFVPEECVAKALDVLEASDDEFVTTTALRQAGIGDIARLLPTKQR